jgi:PAS domain S-box-containing protein
MPVLDQAIVDTIKRHLRSHRRGMTISDLSSKIKLNRNLMARYLDLLLISGQVEMQVIGAAKVYFLSHRVPISAMLEFSSDYVIVLDTEQRVVQVNEPVLNLLNEKREALIGKKIGEINNPFFSHLLIPEPVKNWQTADEKITEISSVLNGKTFHFRVQLVPTAFENGGQGVTFIIEDITDKKTYEETLQMNEARYRGIVEDQTEFITRFRPDGTLIFVNNSYARYLGKKPTELLGQHHIPGICDKDRIVVSRSVQSLDAEQPMVSVECRIADPSGHLRWNVWTIRALFNDEGNLHEYQGVGRDTTDKREAARRINQYISERELFSQKLQEFIELSPDADIYNAIGEGLYELLPGSVLAVNSYDTASNTMVVRGIFGEKERELFARYIGRDFVGLTLYPDVPFPEIYLTGKVNPAPGDIYTLYEATFGYIPKETCDRIEEELTMGNFFSMAFVWQGVIFGSITFALRKGEKIENFALIETYGRAASIVLQRQIADAAFKESERKRAEEALKNSENYLLTIFNATQSGLVVIDPETRLIYDANSTAVSLIDKEKGSLIGSSCNEYLCPKENQMCPVIDRGQELVRSEGVLRNTRGEERPIIKTVVPVQLGGRSYLLESFIDITERKRAEEALLTSEKRFQALAEMLPQNIWECDNGGNVTFVNHRGCEMYGYTSEDVAKGMTIWQTIHPDDRDRVIGDFVQALTQEPREFPEFHEFMSIRKDGSTFPLITYHLPIVHENKITGMRGIGIDISDRKRTEVALKESEERFRLLVESVPFGISFISSTGTIEYVNPAFEKICGYTREEVPDLTIWSEKVFPDPEYREKIFVSWLMHIQTLSGTNPHADNIFRIHRRDGKDRDILFKAVFFSDGKVLVTIEDITERTRAEEHPTEAESD